MFTSTTKENEIKDDLRSAKGNVRDAGADVNSAAQKARGALSDSMSDIAEEAGYRVRKIINNAEDEFTSVRDTVRSEVQNSPFQSIAIAAGVGALVALLFRR